MANSDGTNASGASGTRTTGSTKPTVVIAGAGIAGLSAAQVLIDAGCDVTVIEKSGAVGGKCFSYKDRQLGHTVEHGIHGVFPRYANLKGLWKDAGIDDSAFGTTRTTGMAGHDGKMHSTELAKVTGAAPFFLLRMPPSGIFRLRDYVFSSGLLYQTYVARWTNDEALDETTFGAMLRRSGVSDRMSQLLLSPYLRNLSYARGDEVSAQAACLALNYYVIEHADDVKAHFFRGGPSELVFEPWRAALEKRGVKFIFKTPVEQIVMDGVHFKGFSTRAVITDAEVGPAPKLWTQQLGHHFLALHWEPATKTLNAYEGHCTHQGCAIGADMTSNPPCFRCPCHGGVFSESGAAIKAPPTQPLPPVTLRRDDAAGAWILDESDGTTSSVASAPSAGTEPPTLIAADFGIMAMDLASTQAVLPRQLVLNPSTAGIQLLRSTSVMVLRMRFSAVAAKPKWQGPDSGVFTAPDFLDNFFALHTFQPEFAAMDDLFLECHVGDCEAFDLLHDDDVFDRAVAVLEKYFPEEALGQRLARDKSRILRHENVFPLFAPGDYARTPTVSNVAHRPNLMLAGDWVRPDDIEHRSWFMERAAVTGVEAANRVLESLGKSSSVRALVVPESPAFSRWISMPMRVARSIRTKVREALGVENEPSP